MFSESLNTIGIPMITVDTLVETATWNFTMMEKNGRHPKSYLLISRVVRLIHVYFWCLHSSFSASKISEISTINRLHPHQTNNVLVQQVWLFTTYYLVYVATLWHASMLLWPLITCVWLRYVNMTSNRFTLACQLVTMTTNPILVVLQHANMAVKFMHMTFKHVAVTINPIHILYYSLPTCWYDILSHSCGPSICYYGVRTSPYGPQQVSMTSSPIHMATWHDYMIY